MRCTYNLESRIGKKVSIDEILEGEEFRYTDNDPINTYIHQWMRRGNDLYHKYYTNPLSRYEIANRNYSWAKKNNGDDVTFIIVGRLQ